MKLRLGRILIFCVYLVQVCLLAACGSGGGGSGSSSTGPITTTTSTTTLPTTTITTTSSTTTTTTTTTVASTTTTTLPPATGSISLPKTGQTTSYVAGDDGALQKGSAWPNPRFTDNSDGTVTDNLTGLIWLKRADCFITQTWSAALTSANTLASGACGLSDGSTAGHWRLPNITELESLVDAERSNPALPAGHPFTSVQSDGYGYWSASAYAYNTFNAWYVDMSSGHVYYYARTYYYNYVWPVRSGQ
ncbi:MAG: DUF1566 domain-containing protein [Desulfuromonadaceae bacterium]|nr:DUF1566 domain-containing protein [Desulfuromonadaceae bacterium]